MRAVTLQGGLLDGSERPRVAFAGERLAVWVRTVHPVRHHLLFVDPDTGRCVEELTALSPGDQLGDGQLGRGGDRIVCPAVGPGEWVTGDRLPRGGWKRRWLVRSPVWAAGGAAGLLAVSADDELVAVGGDRRRRGRFEGRVEVWRVRANGPPTPLPGWPAGRPLRRRLGLGVSAGDRPLVAAVGVGPAGGVGSAVWDAADGRPAGDWDLSAVARPGVGWAVTFAPSGRRLLFTGARRPVLLDPAGDGSAVVLPDPVTDAARSPDGSTLAASHADGSVSV